MAGETEEQEPEYTCPDQTPGHQRRAPAGVSLIDTGSGAVINAVPIKFGYREEAANGIETPDVYKMPSGSATAMPMGSGAL